MSLFRIDILNASGVKVGSGPVINVASVSRTRSLDKIGSVEFELIATDPATAQIGAGRQYKLYHADYGDLGTYYHASQTTGAGGMLRVKAYDAQIELARKSCYFRRTFDNVAVSTVISTLLGLVTDWSAGSIATGIGNATASIEGESVFEAISELAAMFGQHWRLGTATRTLDFGIFGADSGIRLIRADTIPRELEDNDDVAIVTNLNVTVESEAVVNRLIPLGAGTGTTQLTLEYCTINSLVYPVLEGTNADGSTFYYIENVDSKTTYGLIEKPFVRSDIRPLSNSLTNLENAADALFKSAVSTIVKLKDPVTQYEMTVTKFDPASVKVGDTVRLVYRGVVFRDDEPYKWLDIDDDLYVLDIVENWNSDGVESVRLTVGTSADRRTQDEDIIASLVRAASVTKTHVQTNLTKDRVGPYVLGIDSTHNATFSFEIGDETLALNYAFLRFKTRHLSGNVGTASGSSTSSGASSTTTSGASSSSTTASGGSSTPTSSSGGSVETTTGSGDTHNHGVVIRADSGAASHTPIFLDVTESPAYRLRANTAGDNTVDTTGEGGHTHSIVIDAHTHTVTIPSHTHGMSHTHNIPHTHTFTPNISTTYGFYEDTDYPDHISLYIDGTDRTTALNSGTWADDGNTVTDTVEITDYLSSQSTLRGTHTVEFRCTGGQGEIEAELVMLMTIQAIAVA